VKPAGTALLDANVWLALAWGAHFHSSQAADWLSNHPGDIAFCRITQLALLRHLTNEAILGRDVHSNSSAYQLMNELLDQDGVLLASEPVGIEAKIQPFGGVSRPAPKRWTDAYLAAFAVAAGLEFVTFDQGFRQFDGLNLTLLDSR